MGVISELIGKIKGKAAEPSPSAEPSPRATTSQPPVPAAAATSSSPRPPLVPTSAFASVAPSNAFGTASVASSINYMSAPTGLGPGAAPRPTSGPTTATATTDTYSSNNPGGGDAVTRSVNPSGLFLRVNDQPSFTGSAASVASHNSGQGSQPGGAYTYMGPPTNALGAAAILNGHLSGAPSPVGTSSVPTTPSGVLDRPPEPAAVVVRHRSGAGDPFQVTLHTMSGPGGVGGSPSAPLSLVRTCLQLAGDIAVLMDKVVANRVRCQRIAQRVANSVPLLQALLHSIQSEPGTEGGRHLQSQLCAVRDVYARCKACVTKWSQPQTSKLKVLTNMLCSKQHEQEFVELNLALSSALNNLNLALQPMYDVQSIQPFEPSAPGAAPPAGTALAAKTAMLAGNSAGSDTTQAPGSASGSEYDDDARSDLRSFVSLIISHGGWSGLGPEERNAISELYRAKGLDLVMLLAQAQSQARATVVCNKLSDLEYINWDDITGPRGMGSQLEWMCVGGKGTLYRGKWQGEEVAVKKMEGADNRKAQEDLARETYIMSTCMHPNIARIFGISREPATGIPSIVMKFYKRGSLLDVMTEPDPAGAFTVAARIRMARGIARGMAYLHERPNEMITHGDLNPRNVLIDERMRPHISDFGLSSMKTQTKTIVPTAGARSVVYTAPEVMERLLSYNPCNGVPRSQPSGDIYAYAMILYELFSGIPPFHGPDMTEARVLQLVAAGQRPMIPLANYADYSGGGAGGGVPMMPMSIANGVSVPLANIIECCWAQDPDKRPTFSQIITGLEAAAVALNLQLDG